MRRLRKIKIDHNSEFELDLAPLLAVMVKLVPVLLVSSAFVQMMVIETELPQVVSEAIQKQEQTEKPTLISLEMVSDQGMRLVVTKNGVEKEEMVPLKEGHFDYPTLHLKLIALKQANPEVFKIEINPDAKVPYNDVVKALDEARQAHDKNIRFPVYDPKQGKNVETQYMFPEVVFTNMMEG
jgi:biopolymer transport protein ExbD